MNQDFKHGDIVQCLDDAGFSELRRGRQYTVKRASETHVWLDGIGFGFSAKHFKAGISEPLKTPFQVVTSKTAGGNGLPNIYVADADGKKVAAIWGDAEKRWDTAYLFAAAPALVEALQAAVSAHDYEGREGWVATAKAAIAKAEGRP